MVKILASALMCTFSLCCAYEQFLTLYSDLNYKGDSITFKSKQPDASNFTHFIINSKSYQGRGYWYMFGGMQYTGLKTRYPFQDSIYGGNFSPGNGVSVRHAGLLETSQQSISFYSSSLLSGLEKVITTSASNDITFTPYSVFSTGFSNWTFFTGSSFDGNATCFISTTETHYVSPLNSTLSNIRSVIRGCVGRIDTYLFAKDFDVPQNHKNYFPSE